MNKSRLVRVLEPKLEVAELFMAKPWKQKVPLPGRVGINSPCVGPLHEDAFRLALFKGTVPVLQALMMKWLELDSGSAPSSTHLHSWFLMRGYKHPGSLGQCSRFREHSQEDSRRVLAGKDLETCPADKTSDCSLVQPKMGKHRT